jgi:anaerobic ribonucleoside-triphosphate reductase activating protein
MNYHDIKKCDMLNGDGIRISLWVSGCEHNCNQCQNPQTWNIDSGILFDEEAGKELLEALEKDYISGITFTGGDPLHENNLEDVLNLVNKIRILLPNKTIWLYTGYTWEEIWEHNLSGTDLYGKPWTGWSIDRCHRQDILRQCDVLVDGRYEEDKKDITLKWRGSANQRVIDIQQSIKDNQIRLYTQ